MVDQKAMPPALTQVNNAIRVETLPMWYGQNFFWLGFARKGKNGKFVLSHQSQQYLRKSAGSNGTAMIKSIGFNAREEFSRGHAAAMLEMLQEIGFSLEGLTVWHPTGADRGSVTSSRSASGEMQLHWQSP